MDELTKQATYINLLLLAAADGRIVPKEAAYLKRFVEAAGISEAETAKWYAEAEADRRFRPISNEKAVNDVLRITTRMVRVDGVFDASEQEALIAMGKALGFAPNALGPALREVWNRDPEALDRLERANKIASANKTEKTETKPLYILDTNAIDKPSLERSAPTLKLCFTTLEALINTKPSPAVVLFHLADDRVASKAQLNAIRSALPNAFIAFIARRDQAPQIGLMLEAGANRCFVAPLYPNEISHAMDKMTNKSQ